MSPVLGDRYGRRERPIRTGRRDKPIIQLPSIALRVAIMAGIAVVLFSIVLFRLWFLQILSGQEYLARANDNRLASVKLVAPRGSITDRHGTVIVENRPGLAVGIRLMDVRNGTLGAEVVRLAHVLKEKPAKIRREIEDHLRPGWPIEHDKNGKLVPITWAKIVRGDAAILGLEGKVTAVKTETGRIIIEGVTVKKADAKMESRSVHASNCVVTKLELKDQWRKDKLQKKEASS